MFWIILLLLFLYQSLRRLMNRKTDSVKCLLGKTAIVTGGNSGLGYGAVVLLASRGCKVIIADCNNGEKSRDEIIEKTGNPNIFYKHLDLASLKNVRQFANDIKKTESKIDFLINIAGIGASAKKTTEDGLNFVMQVNFFGSFLLTHLLLDSLKAAKAARIIFNTSVTTLVHELSMENFNITNFDVNTQYSKLFYSNSKVCNIIASREFGKKLKKYGITTSCIDPIGVKTPIFENSYKVASCLTWRIFFTLGLAVIGQTGIEAAQTILHLAISEKLENNSGGVYFYCYPALFTPRIVHNQELCNSIWEETERLVKLRPEEKL